MGCSPDYEVVYHSVFGVYRGGYGVHLKLT
jgi:hypothetical protein